MKRALIVASGMVCALAACKRAPGDPLSSPSPSPTPVVITTTPTPAPTPTPVPVPQLPRKPVDMGRLFNGVTFHTKFLTPESNQPASVERTSNDSYQVQITFTATLPKAIQSLEAFANIDPKLPLVLNQMAQLVETSQVSPYFDKLYKNKVESLRSDLFNLDAVLSRHNFYDCETILELKSPESGRRALLLIGDMDVNVDGSDGDRNVVIDDSGRFFQPQTSYRWLRQTERPNQTMGAVQKRLESLKKEYATPGLSISRNRELKEAIDHAKRTVSDLNRYSFLISSTDPSIVLPSFMLTDRSGEYAPGVGDYAIVIYEGVLYPAIVGDAGPSVKFGEASLRIAQQLNPKSSAMSRSVSNLKVAYLVFPGTADPAAPPDLENWRAMCKKYLDEIGGSAPDIFAWENIVPAWPTPTPTPLPTPEATPADNQSGPFPSPSPAVDSSPPSPSPSLPLPPTPAVITTPETTPSSSPQPAVISPTTADDVNP